jgi:peptide/nickel transport system substrate-binding protein
MSDIRIRQAIAFAVDKQAIADQLFGGGEPASQLVGPSATGFNPDLTPYPYDMDQARALVEEAAAAGVPVDAELVVVTREGIYLRNDELAEYVASQLRDIGLNCRSEVIEPALYNPEYSKNIKDVPDTRGWITTNPHGNEIMDVSATASSYYRCDGAASTYCDPALDEALDAAIPIAGEERGPALAAVTKMYYDAYASVPVIYMPLNYGLVEGLTWTPRLDAFMLLKEMTLAS